MPAPGWPFAFVVRDPAAVGRGARIEDLADDCFIAAPLPVVVRAMHDRARWAQWWPDLDLQLTLDRGRKGLHWRVGGPIRGTAEVWLERVGDGVVVHYYLRAGLDARARARRQLGWKRAMQALKRELEGARRPGLPVTGPGSTARRRPAVRLSSEPAIVPMSGCDGGIHRKPPRP